MTNYKEILRLAALGISNKTLPHRVNAPETRYVMCLMQLQGKTSPGLPPERAATKRCGSCCFLAVVER